MTYDKEQMTSNRKIYSSFRVAICSVSGAIAMQKLRCAEFFEWSDTWYKTTRATTRALPRSALNQRKYTLCGGRA